jgi:hypothetical protein
VAVRATKTTSDGTWTTLGLLLVTVMIAPSLAGPLNVTVPVAAPPPPRLAGDRTTEATLGAVGSAPGFTFMLAPRS